MIFYTTPILKRDWLIIHEKIGISGEKLEKFGRFLHLETNSSEFYTVQQKLKVSEYGFLERERKFPIFAAKKGDLRIICELFNMIFYYCLRNPYKYVNFMLYNLKFYENRTLWARWNPQS